jgi:putative protease
LSERDGVVRQVVNVRLNASRIRVDAGWKVVRTSAAALLRGAQDSFASVVVPDRVQTRRVDVRVFGHAGGPLKLIWRCGTLEVTVRGDVPLAPATKRALDMTQLREQLGRLGDTPFKLGAVDISGLGELLFVPVSELNRLRQDATEQLAQQLEWETSSDVAVRAARVAECIALAASTGTTHTDNPFALRAIVYDLDQARAAATSGATEIVLDPFLRHPAPPVSRVTALRDELAGQGIGLRLRTPTIVRPEDRKHLTKWLALDLPVLTGHLGLLAELSAAGRDVIGDYALNVFNQHTAAFLLETGASRLVASIELTADEYAQMAAPWHRAENAPTPFDVVVFGRTEGMTIEHCVLSAAFDREPTTCRDLCVQKHPNVSLTDPSGYTFAVATDSDCRNRLLHSRPIDGSEFLPALWNAGTRGFQMLFNVPGDPVTEIVRGYRSALDAIASGERADLTVVRTALNGEFTRGHFARAV